MSSPTRRDQHILEIEERGRDALAKASGYNRRSKVEASIGRYKRVIGDALKSRADDRRKAEVAIAVKALNRMRELGQAHSSFASHDHEAKGRMPSPRASMQQGCEEAIRGLLKQHGDKRLHNCRRRSGRHLGTGGQPLDDVSFDYRISGQGHGVIGRAASVGPAQGCLCVGRQARTTDRMGNPRDISEARAPDQDVSDRAGQRAARKKACRFPTAGRSRRASIASIGGRSL